MTPESRNNTLLDNGSVNRDTRYSGYAGVGQNIATDWHKFPRQRIVTKAPIPVETDNTE
jgi:hypothetical protein